MKLFFDAKRYEVYRFSDQVYLPTDRCVHPNCRSVDDLRYQKLNELGKRSDSLHRIRLGHCWD